MRRSSHHIFSRTAIAFLMVAGLLFPTSLKAQSPVSAAQIKAVFLYNFTQFVDWPPKALNGHSQFVIGLYGGDPFGNFLESVVAGEKVMGLPIVVKRFNQLSQAGNCHILYIHKGNIREIADQLQGQSVLTVGDADQFAVDGGMIRFFIEKNKTRLQINMAAARAANLSVSSKLLRVSEVLNQ